MNKELVTLLWWPHSGGRWLSRSILKNHSKVFQTTFVHPWIFNTSDVTLAQDITAQVHKARSLPELSQNLEILKHSTDYGRKEGLKRYYNLIQSGLKIDKGLEVILGESCMGSPEPKPIDLNILSEAVPEMKYIHLVRNPINSLNSFKSRYEMDGDVIKIAGSWLTLNAMVRNFFNVERTDLKDKCIIVRYEDLLDNTKVELEKICSFIGIEFEINMLESIDKKWGKGSKPIISKTDEDIIRSIAEIEMKNYGYL